MALPGYNIALGDGKRTEPGRTGETQQIGFIFSDSVSVTHSEMGVEQGKVTLELL